MYDPQRFAQLQTIFGDGYVPEQQHGDGTHRRLPPPEHRDFIVDFDELPKRMRAALSASVD